MLLRLALVALCVLLAAGAGADYVRWKSQRDDLLEILRSAGIDARNEKAFHKAARERTPHHAELTAARALVNDVLSTRATTPAAVARRLEQLAAAQELARRALRAQPNSWQAHMLLGAAVYLERSLQQDPRLYTAFSDWEQPLRKAVEDTAGKLEPRRMLAAAYLECWPSLRAEKKTYARELLREVFRNDPAAFQHLATTWLAVAEDRETALELIPDQPAAWQHLEDLYAGIRDWTSFCEAYARRLAALEDKLRSDLDEARRRLRLGDLANSRTLCLKVVTSAPPSQRFVPFVVTALEIYPPGLHGLRSTELLHQWLRYALRLNAVAVDPLPPATLSRLTDAVGALENPEAAHAALIAEDSYRIQRAEQLSEPKAASVWAPYLIAKSRRLVAREPDKAAQALDEVGLPARAQAPYWLARLETARALGDRQALAEAERELAAFRRHEWSSFDWRLHGGGGSLLLLPASAATGLRLELLPEASTGAAVEVKWNGQIVAVQPVRQGQPIDLSLGIEPRPYLLEIRALAGSRVTPGRVQLQGAAR